MNIELMYRSMSLENYKNEELLKTVPWNLSGII